MSQMDWTRCREQVRESRLNSERPFDFPGPWVSTHPKAIHQYVRRIPNPRVIAFSELRAYMEALRCRRSNGKLQAAREVAVALTKVLRNCQRLGPAFSAEEMTTLRTAQSLVGGRAV